MLPSIFGLTVMILMKMPSKTFLGRRCQIFLLSGLIAMSLADFTLPNIDDDVNFSDEEEIYIKPEKKNDTLKENETILLEKYHKECMNITNIDESLVEKLRKGFWGIDNRQLKEWAFCVLTKLGIMTEQAVFRVDVAMKKISECEREQAEMIIDKCLTKKEKPPLETAWMYLKCLSVRDPKRNLSLGIFPRQSTGKYINNIELLDKTHEKRLIN